MTRKMASGQLLAQASANPLMMLAFVLKRSSRVMPGFLGTPGNDNLLNFDSLSVFVGSGKCTCWDNDNFGAGK